LTELSEVTSDLEEIDERERAHWNQLLQAEPGQLKLNRIEDGLDALGVYQLERLGAVAGKKVLELGCGSGEWAVRLALLGAEVYAVDIADEAVALALRRAEINGVGLKAFRMSAYNLDFPANFFDLVHGVYVLHHLDCAKAGAEIRRVLQPGGLAVFTENSANNPVLMLARKLCGHFGIPKWSSTDEYPLRKQDIATLRESFNLLKIYYPAFHFFVFADIKLFGFRHKYISLICRLADNLIYRYLPFLRRYSYHQILEMWRDAGT
jgi:SAM-dependent methyltransferase